MVFYLHFFGIEQMTIMHTSLIISNPFTNDDYFLYNLYCFGDLHLVNR